MRKAPSHGRRAPRWSAAAARSVLEDLTRSGLSTPRFAARRGLGVERLYRWQRRLRRAPRPPATRPAFAEVTLAPAAAWPLEVKLRDGVTLRFAGAARLDDAVALLGRLSGR